MGKHEDERNVFEDNGAQDEVDIVIHKGGERHVIGKGRVFYQDGMPQVVAEFFDDADPDLINQFKGGIVEDVSIDENPYNRPEGHKPETLFGFPKPPRPIYEEQM